MPWPPPAWNGTDPDLASKLPSKPAIGWKEDNAAKMLALRVARANNEWDDYWQNLQLTAV